MVTSKKHSLRPLDQWGGHPLPLFDKAEREMLVLAASIEDVISKGAHEEALELDMQVGELISQALRNSPSEARDVIRGASPPASVASASYLLGQIAFAQLLTSQVASRRADEDFLDLIRSDGHKSYIAALYREELTGVKLAEIVGEVAETVSRKLKILREKGITEFRREGTSAINFLTPAATAIVEQMSIELLGEDLPYPPTCIDEMSQRQPYYMQRSLSFSSTNSPRLRRVS